MLKQIILSLFVLSGISLNAQVKQYILDHRQPVSSVEISDPAFADLEIIGRSIGNADVVMLGEQDHGDAPTFKAKARLIKYLCEQKGFTVIAFESDFYGLEQGRQLAGLVKGAALKAATDNIFSLWTRSDAAQDAFNYMDSSASNGRLKITGFDSQLHGQLRRRQYKADMVQLLAAAKSSWIDSISPLLEQVQRYYPLHNAKEIGTDQLAGYMRVLDSAKQELSGAADSSYLGILLQSLRAYVEQQYYYRIQNGRYMTVRDEQMARNLLWLRRHRYPGEKIIVWAHNYHIAKNSFDAFPAKSGRHFSMGNFMGPLLGDSMYVIGFTSYTGRAGRLGNPSYKVVKPKKESIEQWMANGDPAFSFVDLKAYRKQHSAEKEMFFMKGKMHENKEAVWTDVFDGVFYIRDMYPGKEIQ